MAYAKNAGTKKEKSSGNEPINIDPAVVGGFRLIISGMVAAILAFLALIIFDKISFFFFGGVLGFALTGGYWAVLDWRKGRKKDD